MRFRYVAIVAPNPEAQQTFYEKLLELPRTTSTTKLGVGAPEVVGVRVGETELLFQPAPPGSTPTYHFAFRIPGNQFPEAKRWLAERADLLRHKSDDEFSWDFWDAKAVYVRDPAGNIVELLAFRGLDETERPFTSASLLGVAELGLPVYDVPATVAILNQTLALGLWDRTKPAPDLITPLGERGASFILVTLGRDWFLGERSGDYPLEIALDGVPKGELTLRDQPVLIRGGH
jgi:catechol 2,3-dioxygenase-like lactoylglutathione lyase family enzyme